MSRAQRRADAARSKAKALRIMRLWRRGLALATPTLRDIGRNASVHCRPHSGLMDQPGNEVPPMRERAFLDTEVE